MNAQDFIDTYGDPDPFDAVYDKARKGGYSRHELSQHIMNLAAILEDRATNESKARELIRAVEEGAPF